MKILKQLALVAVIIGGQSLCGVEVKNTLLASDITKDREILDLVLSFEKIQDKELSDLIAALLDLALKITKTYGKIGFLDRISDGTASGIDVLRNKIEILKVEKEAVEQSIKKRLRKQKSCEKRELIEQKQIPCECA